MKGVGLDLILYTTFTNCRGVFHDLMYSLAVGVVIIKHVGNVWKENVGGG